MGIRASILLLNFGIMRLIYIQDSTVSWAVERGATIDLLTVGNTTFTGDIRYSINMEDPHDWALR